MLILQWRLQYPTSRHRALPIHICQYHLESLSSSRDLFTESVAPRKPIGTRLESRWQVASSHFVYSHFVEAILKTFIISFDQILIGNRNLFRFIKVKVIRCSFFCNNKKTNWETADIRLRQVVLALRGTVAQPDLTSPPTMQCVSEDYREKNAFFFGLFKFKALVFLQNNSQSNNNICR